MAQRPQAIEGLERREDDETEPEQHEAGDQCLPHRADLRIERLARLRDLVPPIGPAPRQDDIAFEHAQFLVGELVAVVCVDLVVDMGCRRLQRALPQRTRAVGFLIAPADLPIEAAVRFEEALVAERLDQPHLAIGADLRRADHRDQHIFEARVEIARDRALQHLIERETAADQQHRNPERRDRDHAPRQRAGDAARRG